MADWSDLARQIMNYYDKRVLQWPSEWEALAFVNTELAEVYEVLLSRNPRWVRNNPQDKPVYDPEKFAEEAGDAIMMLIVASINIGIDPILSLQRKMERKIKEHEQKNR